MIDGGLSGTVNLVTRKPLDNPGWHIAGTVEANIGDLANEWSPGFSILGSGTFESGIGTFGLQLGYTQQELVTRTDASQITDPCYRAASLDAACIRVRPVGSGGFGGGVQFSKHTVNAVLFYELGGFSARAAYNWRSDFLQTPRDVIFPFSPIYGESTGQLDASIFYDVTDNVTIGVQGVNLLDEVTRTSQVIDYSGTRATRSAFRNDRRYTFLVRFAY